VLVASCGDLPRLLPARQQIGPVETIRGIGVEACWQRLILKRAGSSAFRFRTCRLSAGNGRWLGRKLQVADGRQSGRRTTRAKRLRRVMSCGSQRRAMRDDPAAAGSTHPVRASRSGKFSSAARASRQARRASVNALGRTAPQRIGHESCHVGTRVKGRRFSWR
jgi:hypothetical protein